MAQNQYNPRGAHLTMPVPIADNSGIGPIAGEFLGFGDPSNPVGGGANQHMLFGVAGNSYTPPTGVVNPDGVSVAFEGVWYGTVIAESSKSPLVGCAIHPGDPLFADDDGTYDGTTGCYYGFTINCDSANGHLLGNSLDAVTSGATATVRIRLRVGG